MYTNYINDFLNIYIYITTESSFAVLNHTCFIEVDYWYDNYIKHLTKLFKKMLKCCFQNERKGSMWHM